MFCTSNLIRVHGFGEGWDFKSSMIPPHILCQVGKLHMLYFGFSQAEYRAIHQNPWRGITLTRGCKNQMHTFTCFHSKMYVFSD